MRYYIRSQKRRSFQIEQYGEIIGEVLFKKWTKNMAYTQLLDANYIFKKISFWRNRYMISKNDHPIGMISFNWKGHVFFKLAAKEYNNADLVPDNLDEAAFEDKLDGQATLTYIMKRKGIFKPRLEIYQEHSPQPLLTMYAQSNWLKVNYEVIVHYPDSFFFPIEDLLSMFGYAAVLVRQRRAAAGAAA